MSITTIVVLSYAGVGLLTVLGLLAWRRRDGVWDAAGFLVDLGLDRIGFYWLALFLWPLGVLVLFSGRKKKKQDESRS